MKKVKYSLVIPCYNISNFAINLVNMLQNTNYDNYEVIFVDDCSTDDTFNKLQNLIKYDNFYLYKLEKNSGPGVARNFGLSKVNGDYVLFVDSDDLFDSSIFYEFDKYDLEKYDLIVSPFVLKKGKKEKKSQRYASYHNNELIDLEFIVKNDPNPVCKLYKSSVIRTYQIQFPDKYSGEDQCFVIEYLSHISNCLFLDKVYYWYIMNQNSVTHSHKGDLSKKTNYELLEHLISDKFPNIDYYMFATTHMIPIAIYLFNNNVKMKKMKSIIHQNNLKKYNWISKIDLKEESFYRRILLISIYKEKIFLLKLVLWIRKLLY